VIAVALVLYLVVRRCWRDALLLGLVVGLGAAPWFVYSSALPSTGTSVGMGRSYFALYFSRDPYGFEAATLSDLWSRFILNLQIYARDIIPGALFPHITDLARLAGPLGPILLWTISGGVVIGFLVELRQKRAAEGYVGLFFASCIGYLWAQSRLIVPLIPFAIYYLIVATREALRVLARGNTRVAESGVLVLVAILGLSALQVELRAVDRNVRTGFRHPLEVWYERDAEWANYLKAMRWVSSQAAPGTNIMCRKADLMYIVTGLHALEYPYSSDGQMLKRAIIDVDAKYVIEDGFSWTGTTEQYLRPALQGWREAEPGAMTLAMDTDAPRTRVWRINNLH
jgi:hypothetical protein